IFLRHANCPQWSRVLVLGDAGSRLDRPLHNILEWRLEIVRTLADHSGWCENACRTRATRSPTRRSAKRHHAPTQQPDELSHILRSTASPRPPLRKTLVGVSFALVLEHCRPMPPQTKRLPQRIAFSSSCTVLPNSLCQTRNISIRYSPPVKPPPRRC